MKYAIPFIIILSSCSFDQVLLYKIDPAVEIHVNSFYQEAAKRGIFIPKENLIVEQNGDISGIGLSQRVGDQRLVWILDWCVENYTHDALEALVFHELGHALLDLDHTGEHSLMSDSYPMRSGYEDSNRELLLNELFSR